MLDALSDELVVYALVLALLVAAFCWGVCVWVREPSYEELVQMKERLEYAVTFWRYPEGGYVPQHKRLRLMRELRRVCRQLDFHQKQK